MALTESQQLQRAEVTMFVEDTGKRNSNGKPIYRILNHVRVEPLDSAGNPSGTFYEQPMSWPFQLISGVAMPPSVIIEQKAPDVESVHLYARG